MTMMASGWAGRVLAACLAAGVASAAGSPANAASPLRDGPRLLTVAPGVLFANTQQWVHAYWLGTETVCGFRLTADGPTVEVGYPANTGTYTSFYRNDSLDRLEPDFTALNLTATRVGPAPLRLHLAYQHRTAAGRCAEKVHHSDLTVRLSVLPR
jgi:hypothetical protein